MECDIVQHHAITILWYFISIISQRWTHLKNSLDPQIGIQAVQDSDAKSHVDLSAELPNDATCAKYLVSDRLWAEMTSDLVFP